MDGRDEVGCGWEGEGGRSEVGWGCGTCVEGEGCLHLVAIAIIFSTHTHNVQIEAGQYCSFVIYSDGTMKACGKVGIMYYCVFIMVGW